MSQDMIRAVALELVADLPEDLAEGAFGYIAGNLATDMTRLEDRGELTNKQYGLLVEAVGYIRFCDFMEEE